MRDRVHSQFDLSSTQRIILETVWRQREISRVEIAKATGLTGATVTRLTRELEDLGLTSDRVQRDGARGQPARPVSLVADGAYALGINFSHSYIDVGLVNLLGEMAAHDRLPLERPTPSAIGRLAQETFDRLRRRISVPLKKIVGAGVSAPGDFNASGRLNAHAYFPELADLDLGRALSEHLTIPLTIENDAASAALGERVHGAGLMAKSFILVHVGHGIGAGLVLDGNLHRGSNLNAGLLGVSFPMDAPRPSGQDLFETLQAAGIEVSDFDALDALDLDEPAVSAWLSRAGRQLAEALYGPTRLVDPDAVILGGRLPPRFLAELFRRTPLDSVLARNAPLPSPRFLLSKLGPFAGVVGAASACFFQSFFKST